ncbi:hypothetical protein QWZ13_05205 [Reinekea marina]|nr:hypothetical protein [Reinekea marina]MDN3648303.1 hypothetical protein [Reinekea marina]
MSSIRVLFGNLCIFHFDYLTFPFDSGRSKIASTCLNSKGAVRQGWHV